MIICKKYFYAFAVFVRDYLGKFRFSHPITQHYLQATQPAVSPEHPNCIYYKQSRDLGIKYFRKREAGPYRYTLPTLGEIRLAIKEKPNCFRNNAHPNIVVGPNLTTPILVLRRAESKQMENELSYPPPLAPLLQRLRAHAAKSAEKEDLCQGEAKD
jgi:hypothetical protein